MHAGGTIHDVLREVYSLDDVLMWIAISLVFKRMKAVILFKACELR